MQGYDSMEERRRQLAMAMGVGGANGGRLLGGLRAARTGAGVFRSGMFSNPVGRPGLGFNPFLAQLQRGVAGLAHPGGGMAQGAGPVSLNPLPQGMNMQLGTYSNPMGGGMHEFARLRPGTQMEAPPPAQPDFYGAAQQDAMEVEPLRFGLVNAPYRGRWRA